MWATTVCDGDPWNVKFMFVSHLQVKKANSRASVSCFAPF